MVYVFLADGFEETEAVCPVDVMRRADIDVVTVSINAAREVTGSHGITIIADTTAAELDFDEVPEMVILPGGMPGASNLEKDSVVKEQILRAAGDGIFIGAICAAPMILGNLGLLKGRRAVCYPGFEKYLAGASVTDADVVKDGNIITARGMGAALDFGLALVAALRGSEAADEIKKSVSAEK